MTVCAKCGHANPEGARFCNACASPLESDTGTALPPSVQADLDRLAADDSYLNASVPPDEEEEPYVRWTGFPWSTLRTTEQTWGQFAATSAFVFILCAVLAAALVAVGQAWCGLLLVLGVVPLWLVQWSVGRRGALMR